MNAKQIENLRVAYAIMAGIPAERIKLSIYRRNAQGYVRVSGWNDKDFINDCGSVGCMAGWLSAHPHFKCQGLKWNAERIKDVNASMALFGVFDVFDSGPEGLLGKRVALSRIRRALHNVDAIDDRRYYELEKEELQMTE